jgi:hypothetical protein
MCVNPNPYEHLYCLFDSKMRAKRWTKGHQKNAPSCFDSPAPSIFSTTSTQTPAPLRPSLNALPCPTPCPLHTATSRGCQGQGDKTGRAALGRALGEVASWSAAEVVEAGPCPLPAARALRSSKVQRNFGRRNLRGDVREGPSREGGGGGVEVVGPSSRRRTPAPPSPSDDVLTRF